MTKNTTFKYRYLFNIFTDNIFTENVFTKTYLQIAIIVYTVSAN